MKESLYGWYPPSKGIWRTHNQDVTSYATECLYKFGQSKYTDNEGVRTPTPQSVKIRFASRAETIRTPIQTGRTSVSGRSSASGKSLAPGRASVVPQTSPSPRSPEPDHIQITGRSLQPEDSGRIFATPVPSTGRPGSVVSYQGDVERPGSLESDVISVGNNSTPPSSLFERTCNKPPLPRTAWSTKTEATPVTMYDSFGNLTNPMPAMPYYPIPTPDLKVLKYYEKPVEPGTKLTPTASGGVRKRPLSATVHRETPATPPRPVQSARPYGDGHQSRQSVLQRPPSGQPPPVRPPSAASSIKSNGSRRSSTKPSPPISRPPSVQRPPSQSSNGSHRTRSTSSDFVASRPNAPYPPGKFGASPPNGTQKNCSPVPSAPLNYDKELKKHGWKMEIPGDPLNLKGPCLNPRQSYVVKLHGKPVPLKPPKAHMENYTTFFMNTIPKKPLSFTIHPEMMSEVLHAKRMQLQKRDGKIYQTKNFSFIY